MLRESRNSLTPEHETGEMDSAAGQVSGLERAVFGLNRGGIERSRYRGAHIEIL
jgi:hypothetical protein